MPAKRNIDKSAWNIFSESVEYSRQKTGISVEYIRHKKPEICEKTDSLNGFWGNFGDVSPCIVKLLAYMGKNHENLPHLVGNETIYSPKAVFFDPENDPQKTSKNIENNACNALFRVVG